MPTLNKNGKKPAAKHVIKKSTRIVEVKKSASNRKPAILSNHVEKIDNIKIRMYCLGTGDCFILKFCKADSSQFTMMIDCGSCKGTPQDFAPYIDNLAKYVDYHVDLLVVTHEHNDHVNGFAKCEKVFSDKKFTIDEAWFAWTEDPNDPDGRAKKLQEKRKKMKMAFAGALKEFKVQADAYKVASSVDYFKAAVEESNAAFLKGLNTLSEINLSDDGDGAAPLPGMVKIKAILKDKGTKIQYLNPGQIVTVDKLNGFKFYVLGPPYERDYIFKDGKEGIDVYKKKLNFYESALAATAFLDQGVTDIRDKDIPFDEQYIVNDSKPSLVSKISSRNETFQTVSNTVLTSYNSDNNQWRRIDSDWLSSAGSLALRLNSHINNTSLALALEATETKQIILLPGDAEYGSWESWQAIDEWKKKGANGVNLAEDLLSRTIFYKVGHHLSYNGTALKLGIEMMPTSGMAAMATLDRNRIAPGWKSTMPNKFLLQELIKRCQGKLFIMDESEITNPPSNTLEPDKLGNEYEAPNLPGSNKPIYKQYTCKIG